MLLDCCLFSHLDRSSALVQIPYIAWNIYVRTRLLNAQLTWSHTNIEDSVGWMTWVGIFSISSRWRSPTQQHVIAYRNFDLNCWLGSKSVWNFWEIQFFLTRIVNCLGSVNQLFPTQLLFGLLFPWRQRRDQKFYSGVSALQTTNLCLKNRRKIWTKDLGGYYFRHALTFGHRLFYFLWN